MNRISYARFLLGFLLIAVAAWATACSVVSTPTPPPREIIAQATEKFNAIQSLHFVIEFSGSPTYLDRAHTLALRRVEGDIVRPNRMRANVKAALPGAYIIINAIGIGEQQFATNPLNGTWEKIPPEWGFNPAILFQPSTGLGALMAQAQNLTALAHENIENQPHHHLRGEIAGTAVAPITGWLIEAGILQAELWIGRHDAYLRRIRLIETTSPSTAPARGTPVPPTQWLIDLSKFDVPVEINAPEIGSK